MTAMIALVSDESLPSVFLRSVFVENILLSFFLGMCSYLAVSKRVDSAVGLGIAVVFVQVLTLPMNWVLQTYVLARVSAPGGWLPESDLSYLTFLTFIASIAAVVQVVEMAVDKFDPEALRRARHLPAADRRELRHPRWLRLLHGRTQVHVRPGGDLRCGLGARLGNRHHQHGDDPSAHAHRPCAGPTQGAWHHVHHDRPGRDGLHDLLRHLNAHVPLHPDRRRRPHRGHRAALVAVLMFCEKKLVKKGKVKLLINSSPEQVAEVDVGSNLLMSLSAQKIFLPSACGGKGSCAMCKSPSSKAAATSCRAS